MILGWPCKSQEESENCNERLDQDKEQFQKNLSNDQLACDNGIHSLKVSILCMYVYICNSLSQKFTYVNSYVHTYVHMYVFKYVVKINSEVL